jgi:hypothetical protein
VNGVAYGGGKWIATGQDTTSWSGLFSSSNGISWTPIPGLDYWIGNAVAYGNGKWIAVGVDATYESSDGISWTPIGALGGWNGKAVAYANGKWVAVGIGSSNMYVSSDNGTNWTAVNNVFNTSGYAVAYGNGNWVAVGMDTTITSSKRVYVSTDNGNTWNAWNVLNSQQNISFVPRGVAYGNGKWIIGGENGYSATVFMSDDNASTWYGVGGIFPSIVGLDNYGCYAVAYANNTWVLVGRGMSLGGSIRISTDDASTWYKDTSVGNSSPRSSVAYGNGLWVVGGSGPTFTTTINPKCV